MARLGELLVSAGVLTLEQCQQALHAQVMWGGRLGTNLIELGFALDLDALSKALGRQHRHPAALERHFDAADIDLQRQLATDVAEQYQCVPLMRIGKDKVIVAATTPLGDKAREIVADELRVEPTGLLLSIAVELRVRYQLERISGIPREARFLRSGNVPPQFPRFEIGAIDDRAPDLELPEHVFDVPSEQLVAVPTGPRARRHATPPEGLQRTEVADPRNSLMPPEGQERRTYLPTLAEQTAETTRAAIQAIHLRRLAIGTAEVRPIDPATATLTEATHAIRHGDARDTVAQLVIQTVESFVPQSSAAILMVVRGRVATGWAGFTRSGAPLPEIVVPIDVPGVVPTAIQRNQATRAPSDRLGAVDQLLLEILGIQDGDLVVVPIAVSGQVIGAIAMATQHAASIASADSIAAAAGAAFARLMREATR